MIFILRYSFAYFLDLVFGDPYWFPHPVRFIGKWISSLEKILYRFSNKYYAGVFLWFATCAITFIISFYLAKNEYLEIFFLYTSLATKSLAMEGKKVIRLLEEGDLDKAKKELSYLVSRDTKEMDEQQISMSTLETIAENTVDGVISPMFYAFIGSHFHFLGVSLALPFAMTYKAINTLDSMVGYQTEQYNLFGRFSAKMDDIANWIPARLAGGIFIPLAAWILGFQAKKSYQIFQRDGNKHASPNSGQSEAAYAGALGVQFGGKIFYFGEAYEKQKIGDALFPFSVEIVRRGVKLLYGTSFCACILFILLGGLYHGFTWR